MARSQSTADEFGEPKHYDPNFKGPIKNRSCTDILCLLLFAAFIVGWVIVAIFAFVHGDPNRLLYPTDSWGQKCGLDAAVKDRKYLFFFDITKCLKPRIDITKGCDTPEICVHECPRENFMLEKASKDDDSWKMFCKETADFNKAYKDLVNSGNCPSYFLNSTEIAGRCIPNIPGDTSGVIRDANGIAIKMDNGKDLTASILGDAKKFLSKILQARQTFSYLFQDLCESWKIILVGLVVAMFVSLIWIILMRFLAGIVVWASLLGAVVLLAFTCWYSYSQYVLQKNELKHPDEEEGMFSSIGDDHLALRDIWLVVLIIVAIILLILILTIIFLRKRILIAVALIKEGSRAVASMPLTLLFPVFPWLLEFIVVSFFIAVAMFLASSGRPVYVASWNNDTEQHCSCEGYEYGKECDPVAFKRDCNLANSCQYRCQFIFYDTTPYLRNFHIYNVVGLFWCLFYASAFGEMVLAGAFASWYWTFHKKNLATFPVIGSLYRTLRYHMGTLAFGSLIIAIVRMIRVFLEYIDHKLNKYDNKLTKALLCCLKCCFWCLEKFLKFINRNAYIMCAIYGKNFCASAKDAFSLLMRNVLRVVVLDKVADFLLFLGKIMVVAAMSVAAFYVFKPGSGLLEGSVLHLHYYLLPVILIAIGTYFIATMFFGVYSMAVDTLFLCFLEDCERNDGSPEHPYYMSKNLMSVLGKKNQLRNHPRTPNK